MKLEDSNKLWEMFVEEVRTETFASELRMKGEIKSQVVNFLGSVKTHQACFKRAVIKFNELQGENK